MWERICFSSANFADPAAHSADRDPELLSLSPPSPGGTFLPCTGNLLKSSSAMGHKAKFGATFSQRTWRREPFNLLATAYLPCESRRVNNYKVKRQEVSEAAVSVNLIFLFSRN